MRRFVFLPVAAALGLVGCEGKPDPAEAVRPGPAARVSDWSRPMTARGTEPFWAVKLEGTRLTLMQPSTPDTVFEAPGAVIKPGRASWTGKAADGRTLTLTLYESPCSDGMSDLAYPLAAEAALPGMQLYGCAMKTEQLPKPAG